MISDTYTISQARELWKGKYPKETPTRQTFYNWCKRFGWCKNEERIVTKTALRIDAKKFNEFLENPRKFLNK